MLATDEENRHMKITRTLPMTIGTAEYIRYHINRDFPEYSFHPCDEGHPGCSSTHEKGGDCIAQLEADNDQRVDVRKAAEIIDNIIFDIIADNA
jgi:hypothetical protein